MAGSSRMSGNFGKKSEESSSTTGQMATDLKNKAQEAGSAVAQKAQDLAHKAQDTASNVAQKAQDAASNVAHKAQDMASNFGHKAQDAASTAVDKTDDALSTVGDKMTGWAGNLRDSAPHEGMIGSAASTVANRLEAGGHYLQEHGVEDMAEELGAVIRRYPVQSVLVGFGVGCLLGLAFSRR